MMRKVKDLGLWERTIWGADVRSRRLPGRPRNRRQIRPSLRRRDAHTAGHRRAGRAAGQAHRRVGRDRRRHAHLARYGRSAAAERQSGNDAAAGHERRRGAATQSTCRGSTTASFAAGKRHTQSTRTARNCSSTSRGTRARLRNIATPESALRDKMRHRLLLENHGNPRPAARTHPAVLAVPIAALDRDKRQSL